MGRKVVSPLILVLVNEWLKIMLLVLLQGVELHFELLDLKSWGSVR